MRILARNDVQHALSMKDAIDIVREAFAQLSTDQAVQEADIICTATTMLCRMRRLRGRFTMPRSGRIWGPK